VSRIAGVAIVGGGLFITLKGLFKNVFGTLFNDTYLLKKRGVGGCRASFTRTTTTFFPRIIEKIQ
jgi:hypothetical protein